MSESPAGVIGFITCDSIVIVLSLIYAFITATFQGIIIRDVTQMPPHFALISSCLVNRNFGHFQNGGCFLRLLRAANNSFLYPLAPLFRQYR